MLGYLCMLGLASLLVAFPAHCLPDTFDKAKRITLSMVVCSCVWVSFLPAYVSARGKDTAAVAVFATLASGAASCSASSFLNATSSFSTLRRTQKDKCLAGILSNEDSRCEPQGAPPSGLHP